LIRQIAREESIGPTALARELDAFLAAGVLIEKRVGNLRLFQANPQSPFYEPFRQLAAALSLSAKPAEEDPARAEGGTLKTRDSTVSGSRCRWKTFTPSLRNRSQGSSEVLLARP